MKRAVLTGDIVRSTELNAKELDDAIAALDGATREIQQWHSEAVAFSRNRGDGWQAYLPAPKYALRAALLMSATLMALGKPYATRISVARGIGEPSPDLNAASGPVFVESGRGLDAMTPQVRIVAQGSLAAPARLFDHIAQGWTPAQARAIAQALAPDKPANREIAARLGISRQSVDQALDAAGYGAINDALRMIEDSAA